MKEWNVYRNGEFIGTVLAMYESEARLAALAKFDFEDADVLSVAPR